ncbi:acyl-CoA carboxylase subunit beta [Carboxydochorda subterranea]|uniref:Acyl-CoA carboxylase subunit beta n=1 Tax=Carboxydichorda subterranea TaxID=3109565 RepID=A0ABZ1BW26_9FIRM|nr:acyl-CoA carboxylase subunit beta [Limnochorda sp. L945t]WRP16803.1 acyl-CoA carboxylase subunit beta [Limnochorda sp. L945t]
MADESLPLAPSQAPADVHERVRQAEARALAGGPRRYHESAAAQGKLFVRERLRRLLDPGSAMVEDGLLAAAESPELAADAVVTGIGRIHGRPVCFMASDSTVKAGSWGARTVEKIVRIQETAMRMAVPMIYLVDSAGARITDQVEMFPGRRHAGRIFYNQVKMSGVVPQVCVLFGPSPAGAAYVPALSDVTIMVDANASAFLGSPRMAEMVIGEKVSLEEMGGARMHCTESGLGDWLASSEDEAIALVRRYLAYMPDHWQAKPPAAAPVPPRPGRPVAEIVPLRPNTPFDMMELIEALVDEGSLLEIKRLYAPEIITALARIEGRAVGIVANQPKVKGGVLFVDSSDKAARFVWLCNAYGIPLLYLADVPGFMIGSRVERQGIIRHGAKMICATSEATVPKIAVIVRKCYGAGLYAMAGPAFEPDCTLALPTAQIAVMGPEAAVNAVYYNRIMQLPEAERGAFVEEKREEYTRDVDVVRLASQLIVDAVVPPERLRQEIVERLELYGHRPVPAFSHRRNPVYPV